jgi:DMSO/TMAO reductase YedYZ molybdopterin-dependent catalytic subunit
VHDISTSVWHGARLRDVLLRCGVVGAADGATNVCFVGGDGDNCKYDTSLQRISVFLSSISKRDRREQNRRWGGAGAAAGA